MDKKTKSGLPGSPLKGGGNNRISTLPRSSNSSLGIDSSVAEGSSVPSSSAGRAVSNLKTSKEMNSGASVKKSSNSALGLGPEQGTKGTVAARENAGVFGDKGFGSSEFGRAAGNNSLPRVGKGIYGSNARAQGTDGGGYPDVPGGSMARARRGLNQGDKS